MSKIICDMCGTAYPDTSEQCPICGCAKPDSPQITARESVDGEVAGYAYVKGGRFSKKNVRKRNKTAKPAPVFVEDEPEYDDDVPQESNRGLTIAIVVLLLAIIAVAAYIYIRFFVPGDDRDRTDPKETTVNQVDVNQDPTEPDITQPEDTTPPDTQPPDTTPTVTEPPAVDCQKITLAEEGDITFTEVGQSKQLAVVLEPADVTYPVTYGSTDPKVASVDAGGMLTAKGIGTATITITCGSQTLRIPVTVQAPQRDETLAFNTFSPFSGTLTKGHQFTLKLRDPDKNVMEVTNWTSSNTKVATVSETGVVTAKAKGTAVISCEYKGVIYECTIDVKPED